MKMSVTSSCKGIFIFIMSGHENCSRHGSLPWTTSNLLTFFSVSLLDLLKGIADGGMTLHMWRLVTPRQKCILGFISARKIHCRTDGIFLLHNLFGNSRSFSRSHQRLDAGLASNIRKWPELVGCECSPLMMIQFFSIYLGNRKLQSRDWTKHSSNLFIYFSSSPIKYLLNKIQQMATACRYFFTIEYRNQRH